MSMSAKKTPRLSEEANFRAAEALSKVTAKYDIKLVHISTDHLFNGEKGLISEDIPPAPQNIYAFHKAAAEEHVLKFNSSALILRTTFFGWGPHYRQSFSDNILNKFQNGQQVLMFDDVYFTPVDTITLIDVTHELLKLGVSGIVNVCSKDRISKYTFSVWLAQEFGYDDKIIQPIQAYRIKSDVVRPKDLSLSDKKLRGILGINGIDVKDCISLLKKSSTISHEINLVGRVLPYGKHFVDQQDIEAVTKTLNSGWLTQGPAVPNFEERVADYTGAKYAVAVSSATAGLHLAYKALGVEENKSVLTSPITFVSTANAAYFCGGKARFADINPDTANICNHTVADAIERYDDIQVVAPVLFSGSADGIPEVARFAKSKGKMVVEDAAHGLGGSYICGSKIGSCKYSDCTVFSLHPVKSIAAGEGGVITTNDSEIYKSLLRLRSHGINKSDDRFINYDDAYTNGEPNLWYYEMSSLGFHYRLTDIQASLANSQLDKLDIFVSRRRELSLWYTEWLKTQTNIMRAQNIDVELSANHLLTVAIDFENLKVSRNDFMKALRVKNIVTQVHYIPVVNHPFYKSQGFDPNDFPKSQNYFSKALSLPLFYGLSNTDFEYVLEQLKYELSIGCKQ